MLKVAVGPADADNAKLIGAIARHLKRDRGRIRFVVLPVDDLEQSAKAFGQGITSAVPGSAQGLYLIVSDIDAARAELVDR